MSYIHSPRGGIPHGYSNGYAMGGGAQPHSARVSGNGVHGFTFRSRHERIDWKKIASIDLDRIMRELDVSSLQDSIMGITFCDIEREIDTRLVDQNFVTVFKLAQLIIQYLLHSQEVMAHNASVAEERVQQLRLDQEGTKAELTQLRGELEKVKQESHKRKKLLKNQQTLIQATANNYHKCMYCQKAFFSVAYLQAHIHRKHPEFTPRPAQQEDSSSVKKVNEANEKLERELEELRERLKFTESQLVEEKERAQEQMKMHLQQQSQMDTERQEDQHRKELEKWKQEQLNFQKVEMEKMQHMFMKELKEMHDKYSSSQNALSNIESKLGKQSMLGKMMDEDELEEQRKVNKKQQREMSKLKEQLQAEISTLQAQMTEDLKKQEDKWREKQKELKGSHREEVKELKALLKQTKELLNIEREGGDQKGAKYQKQIQDLMKKNKDFEKQIRNKEEKIKDLKVKASKHYEVVQPLSSPPQQMTISDQQGTTEDNDDTSFEQEGMDTLSRVLQESESWLTGTHPSYNLSDSDVSEDELDAASGNQKPDQHHTFSHNKERIIAGLKDELSSVLQRSLEKRGVPEGMQGISAQSLENKVRVLRQERQQLAKQHAKFYDIRERFKREVDRKASEMKKSGKPVVKAVRSVSPQGKKKPTTLSPPQKVVHTSKPKTKTPVQKPHPTPAIKKMSPGQVRTPPTVVPRGPMPQGKGLDTPTQGRAVQGRTAQGRRSAGPQSATRVSFEDESEEDEEDESEEEEESESFDDEDDVGEDPIYKTPHVPPRAVAQPQPATNGFHSGQTEGDMEDESESEWDSEDISELEEVKPVGGRPSTASTRQPQGPMVASLTKSIEMQLSGRRQGQKPVGGVDLGGKASSKPPQPAPRTPSPSPTPRIPTIPDAGSEDDEDSQSLSISSLGDSTSASAPKATSPTPAPRKKPSNDTDMSSNTYGTSMWGSSKGGDKSKGGGTGKSSIVSVTDFDDDDDDLSLDEL